MLRMIVLIVVLILPVEALSQITFGGCTDVGGVPVASIRDDTLNDVAKASFYNGRPVIQYNPRVLAWVSPQTRLFFYGHECGHHKLGHLLQGLRLGQEQEADCFGIVVLVRNGMLSETDIRYIQRDLAQAGAGDWTHLPGPQRAINLRACLQQAGLSSGGSSVTNKQAQFRACMVRKVQRCIESCTGHYGYSFAQCQSSLCQPGVGRNRQWNEDCAAVDDDDDDDD